MFGGVAGSGAFSAGPAGLMDQAIAFNRSRRDVRLGLHRQIGPDSRVLNRKHFDGFGASDRAKRIGQNLMRNANATVFSGLFAASDLQQIGVLTRVAEALETRAADARAVRSQTETSARSRGVNLDQRA